MRTSTSQEVTELRTWAQVYGKATRKLSVRAKSTKDNSGILPIFAYGRCVLTANLSSRLVEIRSSLASQDSSSSESDSEATVGDCGPIFLEFLRKGCTLLVSHDQRTSGMLLLRVLAQDWRPKQHSTPSDTAKGHNYALQIKRTACYFTVSSLAGSN